MNISGKHISILGAVRSGVGAAKLALANGAIPFVSDYSDTSEVKDNCKSLNESGIKCEFGGHTNLVFDCDFIITSPGVPSNANVIIEAIEKGIKVISEIEFASWFCKGTVIAITGTNGKTTTTTLCAHVFNSAEKKCYLAGNIGVPFSEIAMNVKVNEFVALEVSSFQLDFIDQFRPTFSILLNITPDHLDRYEDRFDLYIKSKMRIVENQKEGNFFIYNGDDPNIPIGYVSDSAKMYSFSLSKYLSNGCYLNDEWIVFSNNNDEQDVCKVDELSLNGEHNIQNSLAVINVALLSGLKKSKIQHALTTFSGVEHRLEYVKEICGIRVINDSKATNVDSVWYALRSFKEPIYLILGGKDKGNDYSKIKDEVKKRVKKIYAIGSSSEKIYNYFNSITDVEIVENLEDTVTRALDAANSGDVLLLSPACASFDMFKSYEDRGSQFKNIIMSLDEKLS